MKRAIVASLCAVLIICPSAFAGTSSTITYEGQLKDKAGNLLHGEYDILFTIYDRSENGQVLWQEQHYEVNGLAVAVDSGWYLVELGSINPIPASVINKSGQWLGIRVGSEPEISPRITLVAGASAYRTSDRIWSRAAVAGSQDCNWSARASPVAGNLASASLA